MQIASVRGLNGEVPYRIVIVQDTASRRQIEAEPDQSRRLHDTDAFPSSFEPTDRPDCRRDVTDRLWGELLRIPGNAFPPEKARWRDYATEWSRSG